MNTPKYIALGLMSGTSLDGVDAAFLETDGQKISRFGPSLCLDYSKQERQVLKQATQEALSWKFHGAQPESFKTAKAILHRVHVRAVKQLCSVCLLYTSPSPRDATLSRMPSSA